MKRDRRAHRHYRRRGPPLRTYHIDLILYLKQLAWANELTNIGRGPNSRRCSVGLQRDTMKASCWRKLFPLLAVLALLAGQIVSAIACGYDGSPNAALKYPRAIEVATALRDRSNAQILDKELVSPTFINMLGYHRAVRRLRRLRDSLERAVLDQQLTAPSFSLLLVESGLWTRYVPDAEGVSIVVHALGPQPTDAMVFTGEAVFEAIMSERLSVDEAFRRGLIAIDGSSSASRELSALLRAALVITPDAL